MKLMILVPKELIRIIGIVELLKATVAIGTCFRASLQWSHCEVPFISSYNFVIPKPRGFNGLPHWRGMVDGVEDEIEVENDELKASMMHVSDEQRSKPCLLVLYTKQPRIAYRDYKLSFNRPLYRVPMFTNQMGELFSLFRCLKLRFVPKVAQSWSHLIGENETDGGGC